MTKILFNNKIVKLFQSRKALEVD